MRKSRRPPQARRSVAILPAVHSEPPPGGAPDDRLEKDYRRLVELSAQDDVERQRGIRPLKVITGNPHRPYIALTFDDGPHGARSQALLDTLRQLDVPATFFVVGAQVRRYPQLIERISLDGHELGNHTFHHYRLTRVPAEEVAEELNRTRAMLKSILGAQTRLFRPPGGEYDEAILKTVEQNGYVTVLWTDDPADYKKGRTAAEIERLVLRDITPGGIVLLHDGIEATRTALPRIVQRLRRQGYVFVTVSELIQRGGGLQRVRNFRISRTSAE